MLVSNAMRLEWGRLTEVQWPVEEKRSNCHLILPKTKEFQQIVKSVVLLHLLTDCTRGKTKEESLV